MFIHNYINEFKLGSCVKRTGTLFASSMLMLISQSSIAVGVGEAQVNSYLNTPLNIQMPITGVTEDELRSLDVKLASYEQFQRLGINPQGLKRYQVKILNLNTGPTIVLTSDQPFKESYIEIAIVIRFAGGELVKAVSAFIDPAPAMRITNSVSGESQYKVAIKLESDGLNISSKTQDSSINQPLKKVIMAPVQMRQLKGSRVWGPTQLNDSLWKVARRMRNDGLYDASLYQIMMAVFYDNQDAFYKGRISRLKMAYMLRLPNVDAVNRLTKSQALKLFQAASRGVITTRPSQRVAINPTRPIESSQKAMALTGSSNNASSYINQDLKNSSMTGRSIQKSTQSVSRNLSNIAGTEQSFDVKALIDLQSSIQSNKSTALELKHQNEALKFQLAEIVMRLDRIQLQLEQDVASTQQLIKELNQQGLNVAVPRNPNQPREGQVNNVAAALNGSRKLSASEDLSVVDASNTQLLVNPNANLLGIESSSEVGVELPSEVGIEGLANVRNELANTQPAIVDELPIENETQEINASTNKAFKDPANIEKSTQSPLTALVEKDANIAEALVEKKTGLGMYILGFLAACVLAFLSMLAFYIIKRHQSKANIKINPIIARDEPLLPEVDATTNQKPISKSASEHSSTSDQVDGSELDDGITYERKGMEFVNDEEQDSKQRSSKYTKELPAINRNQVQLDLIKTSAEAYLAYGRYDEAIELVDFETSQQTNNATLTTLLQKYLVELKIRVAELQNVDESSESDFGENDIDIAVAAAVANAYSEEEFALEEHAIDDKDDDYLGELTLEGISGDESEQDGPVDEEFEYLESMQLLDDDEYDESVFDEVDDLDVEDSNSLSKKAS